MAVAASTPLPRRLSLPPAVMSDEQLAHRAAAGDQRALAGVFERHHQAIYRYCRALLGNDSDAQDALQNTMIRVVRSLPGERREIALKPWLYRIARNESLRLLAARRVHDPLDDVPLAAPDDTDAAAARQRLAVFFEDLRELPERARTALVLRELNGIEFREIAEVLGVSEAAAKQAVYEARVALQDFDAGRAMSCDEVTRAISDGDRRRLRQRKIRAHLRACVECLAFEQAMAQRAAAFRVMVPPLAPAVAAGLLGDLLGGGGGGGAVAVGAGAGSAVAGAKLAAGAAAMKGAAVAAVTVVAAAGAVGATRAPERPAAPPVAAEAPAATAAASSRLPDAGAPALPPPAPVRGGSGRTTREAGARRRAADDVRARERGEATPDVGSKAEPQRGTAGGPADRRRRGDAGRPEGAVRRTTPRAGSQPSQRPAATDIPRTKPPTPAPGDPGPAQPAPGGDGSASGRPAPLPAASPDDQAAAGRRPAGFELPEISR